MRPLDACFQQLQHFAIVALDHVFDLWQQAIGLTKPLYGLGDHLGALAARGSSRARAQAQLDLRTQGRHSHPHGNPLTLRSQAARQGRRFGQRRLHQCVQRRRVGFSDNSISISAIAAATESTLLAPSGLEPGQRLRMLGGTPKTISCAVEITCLAGQFGRH